MKRLIALVFLCAGAWAAPGQAATWSPPAKLPSLTGMLARPAIAFTNAGRGQAAWAVTSEAGGLEGASLSPGATAFGAPRALRFPDWPQRQIAVFGDSRLVAASPQFGDRESAARVAFGRVGGVLRTSRAVGPRLKGLWAVRETPIVANARGDIAIALLEQPTRDDDGARVYLAVRRAGRSFRTLKVGRSGRVSAVDVAINPRGDVLVAWERNGRIEARVRTLGGRLGAYQRLGGSEPDPALSAALGAARRAVVAWASQAVGPSTQEPQQARSDARIRAALAPRHGPFGAAIELDGYDERVSLPATCADSVRATLGPDRAATVAWVTRVNGTFTVRTAVQADEVFAPAQTLSAPDTAACLGDVATGRSGETLAIWREGEATLAALRPAGAVAYGQREQTGLATAAASFSAPQAAFDPLTGRAWAIVRGPDERVAVASRTP
jgi:hypothetical protein